MKLFNRKTTKIADEATAEKIATGIIRYQRILSNYLNRKTKSWTLQSQLYFMIGCCLLFGFYFLKVLVNALQNL